MKTKLSNAFSSLAFFLVCISLVPGLKFRVIDDIKLKFKSSDIEIW